MSWDKVESDIEKGPFSAFKWLAILVICLFVLFGFLNAVGLVGGKAVERMVLKNSFQYKEGMAQRGAILEANLAEIDVLIAQQPNNDELKGQKRILTAQLRAITINE